MAQEKEKNIRNISKKEIKTSTKDPYRLKKAWEHLQKVQNETFPRFRKSKDGYQISSVKIITDSTGKKTVQVSLINGKKIMDAGDKGAVFQKMMPKKKVNIGKIVSLLDAVREYGFAAVAMGLSPKMKALLLKACKTCGIPLKPMQKNLSHSMIKSNVRNISDNFVDFNNKDKTSDKKESFQIDSLFSLQKSIEQQKKRNDRYLQFVLQRAKERIKEKYFDRLRAALADIDALQKKGVSLTKDQVKTLLVAERFGLKINKDAEVPTEKEKQERETLRLRDLPIDLQTEFRNEKRRYRAIRFSKNKAADLVQIIHAQEFTRGKSLHLSSTDLEREAASFLPPPNQRNIENLTSSTEKIKIHTATKKEEWQKLKKEKQNRNTALMAKTMSANKKEGRKLQQQIQSLEQTSTVHRKTFLSNAVMQDLIKRKQAER